MNHPSRDFRNNFSVGYASGGNPVTQSDNTVMTAKMTRDGSQMAAFVLGFGAIADADVTFALALTESDDDSTYAAVPAADYDGSLTGLQFDSDNTIRVINYHGKKKFVKLAVTPANNSGAVTMFCAVVQGNGRLTP